MRLGLRILTGRLACAPLPRCRSWGAWGGALRVLRVPFTLAVSLLTRVVGGAQQGAPSVVVTCSGCGSHRPPQCSQSTGTNGCSDSLGLDALSPQGEAVWSTAR